MNFCDDIRFLIDWLIIINKLFLFLFFITKNSFVTEGGVILLFCQNKQKESGRRLTYTHYPIALSSLWNLPKYWWSSNLYSPRMFYHSHIFTMIVLFSFWKSSSEFSKAIMFLIFQVVQIMLWGIINQAFFFLLLTALFNISSLWNSLTR